MRLLLTRRVELAEHGGHPRVAGGVADEPLLGGRGGGVHDELLRLRVVRRGGLQGLHVGAVAAFGHAEAAEDAQVDDVLDEGDVPFGTEVLDGTSPQPPLHAGLDHEGEVGVAEEFDGREGRTGVAAAAVLDGERAARHAALGEGADLVEGALAGGLEVEGGVGADVPLGEGRADRLLGVGPVAVEDRLEFRGDRGVGDLGELGGGVLTAADAATAGRGRGGVGGVAGRGAGCDGAVGGGVRCVLAHGHEGTEKRTTAPRVRPTRRGDAADAAAVRRCRRGF